jgi:hypothetical protein
MEHSNWTPAQQIAEAASPFEQSLQFVIRRKIGPMSDHQKAWHHRDHHANPPEGQTRPAWRRAHKDWRLWVVVGLMLLAMLTYVMTMDEAVQPGGKVQEAVPAAPGL